MPKEIVPQNRQINERIPSKSRRLDLSSRNKLVLLSCLIGIGLTYALINRRIDHLNNELIELAKDALPSCSTDTYWPDLKLSQLKVGSCFIELGGNVLFVETSIGALNLIDIQGGFLNEDGIIFSSEIE